MLSNIPTMDRRRRDEKRKSQVSTMDEFPEEFDDVFFHNFTLETDKKIPVLRNIVYKKIKNYIIERVSEYKNIELEDSFQVQFTTDGFTNFQWAVIREELMEQGFNVNSSLDETGKLVGITVLISRKITLTGSRDDFDPKINEESESDEDKV